MWAITGIVAAAAIIGFIEIPSLLKKKWNRELWTFSVLLLMGTGLGIAQSLKLNIPNPLDWIAALYRPFSDAIFSFLK